MGTGCFGQSEKVFRVFHPRVSGITTELVKVNRFAKKSVTDTTEAGLRSRHDPTLPAGMGARIGLAMDALPTAAEAIPERLHQQVICLRGDGC